jgi:hypothetical protein
MDTVMKTLKRIIICKEHIGKIFLLTVRNPQNYAACEQYSNPNLFVPIK